VANLLFGASADTLKELNKVGIETFLVVVGVALHSFLRHYKMGADLDVPNSDERKPEQDRNWDYWRCYWLTFVVLVSLALRFIVGATAHSLSDAAHFSVADQTSRFVWKVVFLISFGVILVEAALAKCHRYFLLWLMGFSVGGMLWSLLECNSPWGKWWFGVHALQLMVTGLCYPFAPREPGRLDDKQYVFKLEGLLTVLAVFYALLFYVDINHILKISS
jgi:hypothetical protein